MAKKRKKAKQRVSEASALFVRVPPRKARYVADLIRGKTVAQAFQILHFTMRPSSVPIIERLLKSAVSNVDKKEHPDTDSLIISRIEVDGGPVLKRYQPRAMGRACMIRKRSSHIAITLMA